LTLILIFTAIGFPLGGSDRYTLVQKSEKDSTKRETAHKTIQKQYRKQNTQNRQQKYKTKTDINRILKKT